MATKLPKELIALFSLKGRVYSHLDFVRRRKRRCERFVFLSSRWPCDELRRPVWGDTQPRPQPEATGIGYGNAAILRCHDQWRSRP